MGGVRFRVRWPIEGERPISEIADGYWSDSQYYLRPGIAGDRPPSVLMTWWAVLFSLSQLARYAPAVWTQAITPDVSVLTVPVEEGLRLANAICRVSCTTPPQSHGSDVRPPDSDPRRLCSRLEARAGTRPVGVALCAICESYAGHTLDGSSSSQAVTRRLGSRVIAFLGCDHAGRPGWPGRAGQVSVSSLVPEPGAASALFWGGFEPVVSE